MSDTFTLYVVDEQKLLRAMAPGLSDSQKYERLVEEVRAKGARWEQLELSTLAFARALEAIDAHLGGTRFLPVLAFNNSPGNVLGDEGECPSFGYFDPEQAKDLYESLAEVPEEAVEGFEQQEGGAVESVFFVFKSASEEAARRGYALAVLHA